MHNQWRSVALTDVGRKRTENQDAVYADDVQRIWLVSDGMGGHADGAAASQAIVAAISVLHLSDNLIERVVQIQKALREVNTQLQQHAAQQLQGQQTGATVVLLTECHGLAALLWAGDSRCYGKEPKQIQQLSWDHSHLREMVRDGHMTEQEAAVSRLSNLITRAIGPHSDVFFDFIVFRIQPESCFLLCSDGLTNELTDSQIFAELKRQSDLSTAGDALIQQTLHKGARDNVSVVLVKLQGDMMSAVPDDAPVTGWNKHLQELNQAAFQNNLDVETYYQHLQNVIPLYQTKQQGNKLPISKQEELSKASTLEMKTVDHIVQVDKQVGRNTSWSLWLAIIVLVFIVVAGILYLSY